MPRPRHVLPRQCHGCQGMPRPRHGLPRPRHVLPRQCHGCQGLPRPRHVLPRQCHGCQGQGQGQGKGKVKGMPRPRPRTRQVGMPKAKDKARLPGPRQCQPWAGKAGPFYVLLGLENTIDEICNYGHPNPTEVTPMSCFESRYASRWNCATLSERMQGQFTGCSGSKIRLTRYAGTGIQIQLRRFQLVVSSPDTHVERNPQP